MLELLGEFMNQVIERHNFQSGQQIKLVRGDLTKEHVDAIVNAANTHLQHGGGVARAIVRSGGEIIQTESNSWIREHGLVTHAKPAYTGGGELPCRYVIHAVGPFWGEGGEDSKLARAVMGALALAERLKLVSIAFPAISTGIFGFPKDRAAEIIFSTVEEYFQHQPDSGLVEVRVTLYDQPTLDVFHRAWESIGFGKS
jgi:O-acetyl-ADP-ribose deacetylase (regulator of RNase III)